MILADHTQYPRGLCRHVIDDTPECERAVYYASRRAARTNGGVVMLRVIDLQDRCYTFLLTFHAQARSQGIVFPEGHRGRTYAETVKNFIVANERSLPDELLPAPDELDEFCSFFVSFLTTSFEVLKAKE